MSDKTKYIIAIVALAAAFSCGRFLTPTKTVTEIKTVTVEKVVYTQTRAKTTIQENKDGSKTTVIISDTNTQDHTNSSSTDSTVTAQGKKHVVNVSALAGVQFPLSASPIVYGANITAPLLGPVTISAWGLSNLTFGAGVGLNF